MKKFFLVALVVVCLFCSFCTVSYAYSASTYSDLAQSATNANNLLAYAYNYDSFEGSDFVIAQIGQYEYRIFWGDLNYNGSSVSGSKVEYIQYVREGSGYDYQYYYRYGTDDTLSLSINNLVVSNIDKLGSVSSLYEQLHFQDNQHYIIIFFGALLFACLLLLTRLCFK